MRKITVAVAGFVLAASLTACGGVTPDDALPQGTPDSNSSVTPNVPEETTKVSTCDAAREAILTGSKKSLEKALKALIADKKADADAREAAQEYFEQTDKDLKKMQLDLIQLACSL